MGPEAIGIFVPLGFFAMVTAIVVGRPLVKAIAKRAEAQSHGAQIPSEVINRLERIEHAVEAIAVEVERISEGQRFTTKLLSEPRSGKLPAAGDAGGQGGAY